jgi:hypothetical protein
MLWYWDVYTYIYTYRYIHIYIYVYIHTHIHIYTKVLKECSDIGMSCNPYVLHSPPGIEMKNYFPYKYTCIFVYWYINTFIHKSITTYRNIFLSWNGDIDGYIYKYMYIHTFMFTYLFPAVVFWYWDEELDPQFIFKYIHK